MFERRLKIFLLILFGMTGLLALRAVQVQLVYGGYYRTEAAKVMTDTQLTRTTRGRILDVKGRVIALDEPCIDAAVEYPAVAARPDERWLRSKALQRIRGSDAYRRGDRATRRAMHDEETERVRLDVEIMWAKLAQLSDRHSRMLDLPEDAVPLDSVAEINEIRRGIEARVEQRRAHLHTVRYERALQEFNDRGQAPWYERLLSGGEKPPRPQDYEIEIAEATMPHIILRDISPELFNELGKNLEKFPGLRLQEGIKRVYPHREAGCHLIGRLSRVRSEDMRSPLQDDPLRRYQLNDLIGRTGLESLCEPLLRGTRGRIEKLAGRDGAVLSVAEALPGQDVRSTLDIVLQSRMQALLKQVPIALPNQRLQDAEKVSMHGAIVIIDVPTGEVRAMASNPDYDANRFDELWPTLKDDELNAPLRNRATQAAVEPGSTVKPIVGLGAIAQGLIGPHEGIECTGYLIINGVRYKIGRCWTASQFAAEIGDAAVRHHSIPTHAPHRGHHGNRDGWLTFADSIERSCNIYFETTAHMMRQQGLNYWFRQFGLGMHSGIGILESPGSLPQGREPSQVWFGGIGQGMTATPLQMANVAATIARNGTWMRPTLVDRQILAQYRQRIASQDTRPDRVELKLPPIALAEARNGMVRVVNGPGGTGTFVHRRDLLVAGKTGTAQVPPRRYVLRRDPVTREILLDENGNPQRDLLIPSTPTNPNPLAPWYRGAGDDNKPLSHAWFIGFAPANDPKIAFAVLVEYGGGGGSTAGPLVSQLLDACIEEGYLRPTGAQVAMGD